MARVGSGHVEIQSRREDEWLHLVVRDNGPGLREGGDGERKSGHKLGFPLTVNRLERLYGTRQRFRLSDAPGGGLQVSIEIPFSVSSLDAAEESPKPSDAELEKAVS